jgi:cation-transporting ATPase 13A3/4/5
MSGGKKNTLFAGTKVLDTQAAPGQTKTLALVVDVGAHTEKGLLVSGILYSPPVSFVFDEHLKVVFMLLMVWGLVALIIVSNIAGTTGTTTWLYAVFIVSQVLPPILPAVLVIGQSTSAARLRNVNIFCVDLPRITIAGKVKVFCFDKTGTLTQEGLEFNGLLPVDNEGGAATFKTMTKDNLPPLLSAAIGCAHTVSKLGSRLVGNPVDVEMFSKSGWTLELKDDGAEYKKDGQVIKVLKQHEFDHHSMSMAVVVQINDQIHVFIKGSFEAVHRLCIDESLPAEYMDEAQGLAANGCYTLGVGHRCLGAVDVETARAMPRNEVETGNSCLALLTFRNNLKPDTGDAMVVLQKGDVRPVMITGDTAMTGVYIARKCAMVPPTATVLLGNLRAKQTEGEKAPTLSDIVWTVVDTATGQKTDEISIQTVITQVEDTTESNKGPQYELAMDGAVFNVLRNEGELIKKLLPVCRVFARMTPVNKVECVELHMATAITAMCGDGGNDCGALRAAHVGVAMSEGEASIVSPFSTSDKSVFAAITVLREGRCCLSTSFYMYDFVLMYGETVVLSKLIYLYISCQLAEYVWVFFEGLLVPIISISLAQTKPLSYLVPRRPTARLLGLETFATVVGICLINFAFMCGAFGLLFMQEWFLCKEWDATKIDLSKWWLLADNFEGCLIGLLVMSQVINAGAVGNFSAGYRANWLKNWAFILVFTASCKYFSLSLLLSLSLRLFFAFAKLSHAHVLTPHADLLLACLVLLDPNPVGCFFRFNCGDPDVLVNLGYLESAEGVKWTGTKYNNIIGHNVLPPEFRTILFIFIMANLAAVFFWVRIVVLGPVRTFLRNNYGKKAVAQKELEARKGMVKVQPKA